MALDSKHPLFDAHLRQFLKMRHTYDGEETVKEMGPLYLHPTSGMIEDGASPHTVPVSNDGSLGALKKLHVSVVPRVDLTTEGQAAYQAYKQRARFPEWVRDGVDRLVGKLNHKPSVIDLPSRMEGMLERATRRGEPMDMLLRRIHIQVLRFGRCGLLGDVISSGPRAGELYVSVIAGDCIPNWDEGTDDSNQEDNLNLVVIDESGNRRTQFDWEWRDRYRVLVLGDLQENESDRANATYQFAIFEDTATYNESALQAPVLNGNTAQEIPFVFVNAKDTASEPDRPPLLPLANLALTSYRGDADYRQALFMQGQDTLVIQGNFVDGDEGKKTRMGAGAKIHVTQGSDAKLIGVDGKGLTEMREAQNDLAEEGRELSGNAMPMKSAESGDALRRRQGARAATLVDVAKTSAFALQEVLRKLARWAGYEPSEVLVAPNLNFGDVQAKPDEVVKLQSAKNMGAPISDETVHDYMRTGGLTNKDYQEELDAMDEDPERGPASQNPDGPGPNDTNPDDSDPDGPDVNPGTSEGGDE